MDFANADQKEDRRLNHLLCWSNVSMIDCGKRNGLTYCSAVFTSVMRLYYSWKVLHVADASYYFLILTFWLYVSLF